MRKVSISCVSILTFLFQICPAFGQSFVYQGRFLNSDGTAGLTETVTLTFSIYDPSGSCLLYQEEQPPLDLATSDGFFSVSVGSPVGNSKRTSSDPALSMTSIFSNSGQVQSSSYCPSGYTPSAEDGRLLRVALLPAAGVPTTLSPDLPIQSVPSAIVAQTLQGLIPDNFLKTSTTATQAAINSLTSGADGSLLHHHDSLYMKVGVTNSSYAMGSGSTLGLGSSSYLQLGKFSSTPTSLTTADAGKTWYDSSTQAVVYWDGTAAKTLGVSGTGLQSLNGSTSPDQFFATGTSGTGPAFSTSSGTHTLNIPLASSGSTVTAGLLSNAQYTTFNSKEPSISTGPATQYWKGNKTWGAIDVDARASISATTAGPISYSPISGVISISTATTSTDGALTATDWNTFSNKLASTLAAGNLFVGNSSNVATGVTLSGDATLSSIGALTLATVGTSGTYTKVTTDAKGRVISGDQLTSSDVKTYLGFTPLNKAGDTMSGDLNLATDQFLQLGSFSTAPSSLSTADAGKTWYDSTNKVLTYWDGTASKTVGLAGSGIQSINGSNASTQTLTAAISGTTPAFSTSSGTHTLNIPMASSGSGVTAGLISNSQYTTFNSKEPSISTGDPSQYWKGNKTWGLIDVDARAAIRAAFPGPINYSPISGVISINFADSSTDGALTAADWNTFSNKLASTLTSGNLFVGNSSNVATGVTLSGDATLSNTGVLTLSTVGTSGTYTKVTTDASGRVTSGTQLTSSDVTTSLGFTPLNKAGDTLTGDLSLSTAKFLQLGSFSTAPSSLTASDAGKTWYDSANKVLTYWDGTTSKTVGLAGSGIQSINGSNASTQTLTAAISGTSPAFSTSSGTHTLNIPMASSGSGVTAGLLSNSEYTSFNNKEPSISTGSPTQYWKGNKTWGAFDVDARAVISAAVSGPINYSPISGVISIGSATTSSDGALTSADWNTFSNKLASTLTSGNLFVGNSSNVATGVALSGDATLSNTGVLTLATVGTSGTYTKVTTDASGRVTSGTQLTSSDVKTYLGFTPLNKAGDTVTGDLSLSTAKFLQLGSFSTAPSSLTASDAGKTWYDSANKVLTYWDGTASKTLGLSGAGIQSINGSSVSAQTLAAAISGTTPAFSTSSGTHTLNIPMASSGSGVTAGLLSNAEYTTLNNKEPSISTAPITQYFRGNKTWGTIDADARAAISAPSAPLSYSSSTGQISITAADGTNPGYVTPADYNTFKNKLGQTLPSSNIWVGSGSNLASPVPVRAADLSVDTSGVLGLKDTGIAGTYTQVTTDSKGRVIAGAVGPSTFVAPTIQKFTTAGTGTYTLPSSPRAPLYIQVRMVGGGGGGSGSGPGTVTGTTGGNTTFGGSLLIANGGTGGGSGGGAGGVGGTASLGSGAIGTAVQGGGGTAGSGTATNTWTAGGSGGASALGGAGLTTTSGGGAGAANTGGGGGGAGPGFNANTYAGAGGGSGGFVDAIITSPLSNYTYVVGGGGGGGGGTFAGGTGGSGYIEVIEHYQ